MEDEDPLAQGSGRMSGKEPRGVSVGMGQGSWEGLVGRAWTEGKGELKGVLRARASRGGLRTEVRLSVEVQQTGSSEDVLVLVFGLLCVCVCVSLIVCLRRG